MNRAIILKRDLKKRRKRKSKRKKNRIEILKSLSLNRLPKLRKGIQDSIIYKEKIISKLRINWR